MTFAIPTVSCDVARQRIERRWWHRFRQPRAADPTSEGLPRLEVVCLPYYLVTVEILLRGERRRVATTVEGFAGTFALFNDALRCEPQADWPCFTPRIDRAAAIDIARLGLQMALIRSRGGSRKPVVDDVQEIDILQYPYWVYYYERWRGRLDLKVVDAVTGGPPGPKIKNSLLTAFVEHRRASSC